MAATGMNENSEQTWWRRPAGGREVLIVALPLVVSSLSWTVMTFVDRMFLYSISESAMSASFTGSVIWFALICFPLGICSYTNTFVSQYFGDDQPRQIGPSMWQGVWTAILFAPIVMIAIPLAPIVFQWADHTKEVTELEVEYFQILCLAGPALLIAQAMSSLYGGRGETWVVMIVDASVSVVNLVLDYLWIFGYAGFPAAGIAGAGWATVTAMWLKVAIYLVLVLRRSHRIQFNTAAYKLDRELFGRLLYYGGPAGVQMLLDVSGFTVFVVLVGKLGEIEQAATSLAFSVNTLAFMPIFGMGMAAAILVGQHQGEARDDLAARATQTTLQVSLGYMGLISALYALTPDLFLMGFFSEDTALTAQQEAIHQMSVYLLLFVAAFGLLDAVQMIYVSALKGAGDTQFVLRASLSMAGLFVVCSWLSVEVLEMNIYGCWAVVTAWVFLMGAVYWLRYRQGKWRSMHVIQQKHHGECVDDDSSAETLNSDASVLVEPSEAV